MERNQNLGKYTLLAQLGRGAFGTVYKATDSIGRTVAVKVLKSGYSDDLDVIARFRREALAAGSLFHSGIATILDFDEVEGRLFIVMRYIEGETLEERILRKGPLSWDDTVTIIGQLAGALTYAHKKHFIHRDIKPANIILGEEEGAVLTDFGLVRAAASSGISSSTAMVGTPAYISPEVWQGKVAGPAADQYSLACVVYEMLTGKVLFAGESAPEVMLKHFQPLELPDVWPSGVPAGIDAVLRKAVRKEPAERHADIRAFFAAVDNLSLVKIDAVTRHYEPFASVPLVGRLGRIAFVSNRGGHREIYVMNADGTNPTRLTSYGGLFPAWSPDGGRIAFVSDRDGPREIYVMNADGSNITRLTKYGGSNSYPAWSPDSSRIAFVSDRDGYAEIYVMNADGSNPTRLTRDGGSNSYPTWSQDGSHIAFVSYRGLDNEIYLMNPDGSNPTRLTQDGGLFPAWSPDGSRIAFVSERDGSREIYVMDTDGSNLTRLTQDSDVWHPAWSPDGCCIAFSSYLDGYAQIYVMNADGSNPTRLTRDGGSNSYPAWAP
jgi:serine/threonine protein kinase